MKKFFTLMIMCVLAIAAQAKITIYVQSDTAPFLWTWGAVGGTFDNVGEWPGTLQMTEKFTHPDTGESFWMYSFPEEITQISFLFNNGDATNTRQTTDIADVTSDRYFVLGAWSEEGKTTVEDVTEDYTEIPDATVSTLGVSGSIDAWGWGDPTVFAEAVEAGKTFKFTIDPSTITSKTVTFKFRPNGSSWTGYSDVSFAGGEAPAWLESTNDGNFKIDFNKYTADAFTFTMTWGGGKSASTNWTLTAEATNLQTLDPGIVEKTWTVAGEEPLCGTNWDPSNTANDMAKQEGGTYKLTLSGLALEAGTYNFKVCADHGWDESYGEGSANKTLTIEAAGTYDVIITFNPETQEVSVSATISTGISSVKSNVSTNAAMFNLQGQRVTNNFRGIAIMNGRKVVVK